MLCLNYSFRRSIFNSWAWSLSHEINSYNYKAWSNQIFCQLWLCTQARTTRIVSSWQRAIHLQQSETFHERQSSAHGPRTSSANILNWVANLIRLMKDKNLFCYSHRSRQKFELVYWSAETRDTKKCSDGKVTAILQMSEELSLVTTLLSLPKRVITWCRNV
jgi:glycosidase